MCNQFYQIIQYAPTCIGIEVGHLLSVTSTTMPSNPQPAVDSAMPNKRKNRALAAEWTASDIELLIDTLHGLCRTHGTDDHSASFKPQAWHIVAKNIEGVRSKGGPKNAQSCKDKWKAVTS